MRTKTCLLTAEVLAAGALSSMAQNVYSVNVVGYVNVPVTTGNFYLLNNPLDQSANGGNSITNILSNVGGDGQVGAVVYTATGGSFNAAESYFGSGLAGGWFPGTNILNPGTGFFFQAAETTNITFVGTVVTSNTVALPGNASVGAFSLVGSSFPVSTNLSSMGLHGVSGDVVYTFSPSTGYDTISSFGPDFWFDSNLGGGPTNGPTINVANGFWYDNFNGTYTWSENYVIQ